MAQNWDFDPATGDYVMKGGTPVETDSLRVPAYIRLKTKRSQWMYAPDKKYGSDFYTLVKRQTNRDTTIIENTAARALQPIADDGRAARVDIENDVVARHGVGIKVRLIGAGGERENLNLTGLGV